MSTKSLGRTDGLQGKQSSLRTEMWERSFRKVMVKVMKIDLRAERARKRAQEGSEVAEENE